MPRTKHSDDYKAQAVEFIRTGQWSYREVAEAADVSIHTVRSWVSKANDNTSKPQSPLSKEELEKQNKELLKENKRLQMELAFSKKVAAWLAKEENL